MGYDIDKVYINDVQVFSSTDNTIGLVVDNEIITGEVFEDYTSHFDGETKQAYKLNAIKKMESSFNLYYLNMVDSHIMTKYLKHTLMKLD